MVDSAGYSLPQLNSSEVELFETIKGKLQLQTYRITGFAQLNSTWSKIKNNKQTKDRNEKPNKMTQMNK